MISSATIFYPHPAPGVLTRWVVNVGDNVEEGQLVAEFEGKNDQAYIPITASHEGKVDALLAKKGSAYVEGEPILRVLACLHDIQFAGLCATCGKDLTQVPSKRSFVTAGVHNQRHLFVTQKEAERLAKDTAGALLKQRKLSLVLDLDHTLIHAATEAHFHQFALFHQVDPKSEQLHEFNLPNSPMKYFVKLRPHLTEFLQVVSSLYELHMYTFGTRAYAKKVARIIDPTERFFKERILSRDDCGDLDYKSLKRIFPCDDSMVVIVDDREDVWRKSKNLIRIEPFLYFVGLPEVNPLPYDPRHPPPPPVPTQNQAPPHPHHQHPSQRRAPPIPPSHPHPPLRRSSARRGHPHPPPPHPPPHPPPQNNTTSITPNNMDSTQNITEKTTEKTTEKNTEKTTENHTNNENNNKNSENIPDDANKATETRDDESAADVSANGKHEADEAKSEHQKEEEEKKAKEDGKEKSEDGAEKEETKDETKIESDTEKHKEESENGEKSKSEPETQSATEPRAESEPRSETEPKAESESKTEDKSETEQRHAPVAPQWPPPPDECLSFMMQVLQEIHKRFYTLHDTNRSHDTKDIITNMRRSVLAGCNVVFSGFYPREVDIRNTPLGKLAENFGAVCQPDICKTTTHLIAKKNHTDKVKVAQSSGRIFVVTDSWLLLSARRWKRAKETEHLLTPNAAPVSIPAQESETHADTDAKQAEETNGTAPKDNGEQEFTPTPINKLPKIPKKTSTNGTSTSIPYPKAPIVQKSLLDEMRQEAAELLGEVDGKWDEDENEGDEGMYPDDDEFGNDEEGESDGERDEEMGGGEDEDEEADEEGEENGRSSRLSLIKKKRKREPELEDFDEEKDFAAFLEDELGK